MGVLRPHLALTVTDGTPWEVFVTHEDTAEAGTGGLAMAEAAAGSCGCSENAAEECCGGVNRCCVA